MQPLSPAPFLSSLTKSLKSNQQLQFHSKFSFAACRDGLFVNELLTCSHILPALDSQLGLLISFIDSRTELYQCTGEIVESRLLWHFPISRQIYKMQAISQSFSIHQAQSISALLNLNFSDIITKEWCSLIKSQKDRFHSPPPGSLKGESKEHLDLAKYEPQIEEETSPNFALLLSVPVSINYFKKAPPSVIADSRKPISTQSLLTSPKKDFRCSHSLTASKWRETKTYESLIDSCQKVEGSLWQTDILNP